MNLFAKFQFSSLSLQLHESVLDFKSIQLLTYSFVPRSLQTFALITSRDTPSFPSSEVSQVSEIALLSDCYLKYHRPYPFVVPSFLNRSIFPILMYYYKNITISGTYKIKKKTIFMSILWIRKITAFAGKIKKSSAKF